MALAGCIAAPAQAQGSEGEFARQLLPQLQAAFPGAELAIGADDPLRVDVTGMEGWDDATINLHRIYGFCTTASADECTAIASEYVANISYRPPPPGRADLRVLVRDARYMANIRENFGAKGSLPYHRAIGDDLFAILAFDSPETIMLAMPATVAELGLSEAEAWKVAREQTASGLPPLPDGTALRSNATLFQDYDYLPSMLADLEAWAPIAAAAGPDLLATAVSDSAVFIGVMPSGPMLDGFRITVEEDCAAQPRCVSPHIYRFRQGKWVIAQ
ncbi:hypothetical protein ELI_11150 [Erythrobacter litoralis HTCC2594]|uniref:Uncharacterized protein n=1 Tax=Erythrobacter litoralis (strain HTCC2594) TaxID=314225 RepID=Q2N7L9_ERYLH|nr:hypothetical protein ELI_11150 [Erythrobacter litoralis HTCC2594]